MAILGGGLAGLAAAYYARKRGIPFTVFEKEEEIGGNCRSFRHGAFRFDCGAHRLHDKDPETTRVLHELLGDGLQRITAPSQICDDGRFLGFPFSPLGLLSHLGLARFVQSGLEIMGTRLSAHGEPLDFESSAVHTYGATLARKFLLNYSEKLWGTPCRQLSPDISGGRLKGLRLRTVLAEMLLGRDARARHLDGAFYYPRGGYGEIARALAAECGNQSIRTGSKVTRIRHDGRRVQSIEVAGHTIRPLTHVVSTLPITRFVELLSPAAPDEVVRAARDLRFRRLILVALFLNMEQVTPNASIYFPDPGIPFTRVSEPRNRSPLMAPRGQTSLLAEIPCETHDPFWSMHDDSLLSMVRDICARVFSLPAGACYDGTVRRVGYAYPVLDVHARERLQCIRVFVEHLENLTLSGRNGRFAYTHLHDMMKEGREGVAALRDESATRAWS